MLTTLKVNPWKLCGKECLSSPDPAKTLAEHLHGFIRHRGQTALNIDPVDGGYMFLVECRGDSIVVKVITDEMDPDDHGADLPNTMTVTIGSNLDGVGYHKVVNLLQGHVEHPDKYTPAPDEDEPADEPADQPAGSDPFESPDQEEEDDDDDDLFAPTDDLVASRNVARPAAPAKEYKPISSRRVVRPGARGVIAKPVAPPEEDEEDEPADPGPQRGFFADTLAACTWRNLIVFLVALGFFVMTKGTIVAAAWSYMAYGIAILLVILLGGLFTALRRGAMMHALWIIALSGGVGALYVWIGHLFSGMLRFNEAVAAGTIADRSELVQAFDWQAVPDWFVPYWPVALAGGFFFLIDYALARAAGNQRTLLRLAQIPLINLAFLFCFLFLFGHVGFVFMLDHEPIVVFTMLVVFFFVPWPWVFASLWPGVTVAKKQ